MKTEEIRKCVNCVKEAVEAIELKQEAWEANEDIVTFNGNPIGATISRYGRSDWKRWFPEFKELLSARLVRALETTLAANDDSQ